MSKKPDAGPLKTGKSSSMLLFRSRDGRSLLQFINPEWLANGSQAGETYYVSITIKRPHERDVDAIMSVAGAHRTIDAKHVNQSVFLIIDDDEFTEADVKHICKVTIGNNLTEAQVSCVAEQIGEMLKSKDS